MKAETKAKRRAVLSLVGLGLLTEDDAEAAQASDAPPERERIRAVLVAEGLAGPIVGALIGWAVQQRREDLTHDALCHDPNCARRRARA